MKITTEYQVTEHHTKVIELSDDEIYKGLIGFIEEHEIYIEDRVDVKYSLNDYIVSTEFVIMNVCFDYRENNVSISDVELFLNKFADKIIDKFKVETTCCDGATTTYCPDCGTKLN